MHTHGSSYISSGTSLAQTRPNYNDTEKDCPLNDTEKALISQDFSKFERVNYLIET